MMNNKKIVQQTNGMDFGLQKRNQKNQSIEGLRLILMFMICIYHFSDDIASGLHHGYIAVEFYFVLSGFFIYKSFQRHREMGTLSFTWKKMKRFIVPFVISVLLLMCLDRKQYFYCPELSADAILTTYFSHFHEFFFCQCIGLTDTPTINHPLWFISILLYGGGILYSVLRNYEKAAISLILPTISFFGFIILFDKNNSLHSNYGLHCMIRGVSYMSLGIMTAYLLETRRVAFDRHHLLVNIFGTISLLAFFMMAFAIRNYDYLLIFFCPLIICSCFIEKSWLNKIGILGYVGRGGDMSMYLYFIHLFVAYILWILKARGILDGVSVPVVFIIYLSGCIISAYALRYVSDRVEKIINL